MSIARRPALDGVHGERPLLQTTGSEPRADIVVIPDCGQTPVMLVGLAPGVPVDNRLARRIAENGCRVLIPTLINRGHEF